MNTNENKKMTLDEYKLFTAKELFIPNMIAQLNNITDDEILSGVEEIDVDVDKVLRIKINAASEIEIAELEKKYLEYISAK